MSAVGQPRPLVGSPAARRPETTARPCAAGKSLSLRHCSGQNRHERLAIPGIAFCIVPIVYLIVR
jgi:hypothetical protein